MVDCLDAFRANLLHPLQVTTLGICEKFFVALLKLEGFFFEPVIFKQPIMFWVFDKKGREFG